MTVKSTKNLEKYSRMPELVDYDSLFTEFSFARNATDVLFQQINRPTSAYNWSEHRFSGNMNCTTLKRKFFVIPWRRYIHQFLHERSIFFDISILMKKATVSPGAFKESFSRCWNRWWKDEDKWEMLVDSGYQSITNYVRTSSQKRNHPL